jgi:hypothetical protein
MDTPFANGTGVSVEHSDIQSINAMMADSILSNAVYFLHPSRIKKLIEIT